MNLPLIKMHGCENDFFFVNSSYLQGISQNNLQMFARNLCNRTQGLGADGLIVWEYSTQLEILIVNSDGSFAGTCGNALRCLGLLALEFNIWDGYIPLKIFRHTRLLDKISDTYLLDNKTAFACLYEAKKSENKATVKVGMGNAKYIDAKYSPALHSEICNEFSFCAKKFTDLKTVYVELANPHWVFISEAFSDFDDTLIEKFGHLAQTKWLQLSKNPNFKLANIGLLSNNSGSNLTWNLKVFERGAGLTKCCGSGAVAARIALEKLNILFSTDDYVSFLLPGGRLEIGNQWNDNKLIEKNLSGEAQLIAKIELEESFSTDLFMSFRQS